MWRSLRPHVLTWNRAFSSSRRTSCDAATPPRRRTMWNSSRAGSKSREKPFRISPSLKWATSLPAEPPATRLVAEPGEELVQDDASEQQETDRNAQQDQRLHEGGGAGQRVGRLEGRPSGRALTAWSPSGLVPCHSRILPNARNSLVYTTGRPSPVGREWCKVIRTQGMTGPGAHGAAAPAGGDE